MKVSSNGRKKVTEIIPCSILNEERVQEFVSPSFAVSLFGSFLGIVGFLKTLFWSILIGFYGVFFNFRNKKSRWEKWSYLNRFVKSFGAVWYSYPNPKDGQGMFPGRAVFYGLFLPKVEIVRRHAKSWRALDPIYNYKFGEDSSLRGYLTDWWYGHRACQSVRNRLILTESILAEKLVEVYVRKGSVNLLSIACGAAQAVTNVVHKLEQQGIIINVTLIDFDLDALKYARKLAQKKGVSQLLKTKRVNMFRNYELITGDYDVVEMVGFLDYLAKDRAKELISHLRKKVLSSDGCLITANILYNWDWLFVRWNINWWMIYRTSSQFIKVLKSGGFSQDNVSLMKEAHEVHCVAICRNDTTLET